MMKTKIERQGWPPVGRVCPVKRALFVLVAGLGMARTACAEAWDVGWFTVDAGGGSSTGGTIAIAGTIGQADAGSLSGGGYSVLGGFWSVQGGAAVIPRLHVAAAGGNVTLSWTPGTPGFVLQASAGAFPTDWVDVPAGGASPVVLRAGGGWRFFRLRRP